jgi:hypothetical protein
VSGGLRIHRTGWKDLHDGIISTKHISNTNVTVFFMVVLSLSTLLDAFFSKFKSSSDDFNSFHVEADDNWAGTRLPTVEKA